METVSQDQSIIAIALASSRKSALKRLIILNTKEEVKQAIASRKQLYSVQRRFSAHASGYTIGWYEVRTNGALKEWKTRPNEWELPCKYGMYEYLRFSHSSNVDSSCGMLAIEAEEFVSE